LQQRGPVNDNSPKDGRENTMAKSKFVPHLLFALTSALATSNAMAQEAINMQGPTSLSETYEAWTVQCVSRMEGEQPQRTCQMSQELIQQESRQRVMMFAIGKAEQAAKATLVLPFGLLLSEGVRVQIGDEDVLQGTYRTCLPAGCVAEIELPKEVIEKFGSAEAASVLMTAISGQQAKTDISLKGFKPAYQRLAELDASAGK
jgi:invasion protein IalB